MLFNAGKLMPANRLGTPSDKDKPTHGTVQIAEPAVEAPVSSDQPLPVGEAVTVRLASVDVETRKVGFTL